MNRPGRPDGLSLNTREADAPSPASFQRASMSPSFSIMLLPSVNPEPAYIAPAAASTIAVAELGTELGVQVYDERGNTIDAATVSPNSLSLVNSFLDRLLFNFLSCAKSTSLASLRPAIVEVLKPRLAKDAIAGADEELQEYLGGDDEELDAFHNGQDTPMDWDVELVWRRARLRCMVYTRLGDMEEEDEEMYISQERMDDDEANIRISREYGIVSPAVAIFLTSILEFVGEHALIVATHASFKRTEKQLAREFAATNQQPSGFPRLLVEEGDVEKIALNANLGRLWRSWRKGVRSPRDSISNRAFRGFSIGSNSRKSSVAGVSDLQGTVPSVAEVLDPDPTAIALPMSEHDVDEIEVPGYSAARSLRTLNRVRPASLLLVRDYSSANQRSVVREGALEPIEDTPIVTEGPGIPQPIRPRSHSLPVSRTPFEIPSDADADSFKTPDEEFTEQDARDVAAAQAIEPPQLLTKKPRSAPTTPSYNSVLDQLSQHVARELQRSPPPADLDDEADPAEGALPFNGNDYIIDEKERAEMESSKQLHLHTRDQNSTSFLSVNEESQPTRARFSAGSSNYPDTTRTGDVSPMEHMSTQSGEVSPIEPSDDEDAMGSAGFSQKTPRELYHEPVSPLLEHHPESAKTVSAPVTATLPPEPEPEEVSPPVPPKPTARAEVRSEPLPETKQPTPQPRQRRTEGRSEEELTKSDNREAFVIRSAPRPVAAAPPQQAPLPVPPKDQPVESSPKRNRNVPVPLPPEMAAPPNLAPLREMVDTAHDTSDEASSATASQPEREPTHISRRAVSSTSKPPGQGARQSSLQRPLPPVAATPPPGFEKAAVQRVSSSGAPSRDSTVLSNRVTEANPRNSQGPSKPTRTRSRIASASENFRESVSSKLSSEGKTSSDDRFSRNSLGGNERVKDFDSLINSEETIQYTLTPQNMRNIEERQSYIQSPTTPTVKSPPPRIDSAAHGQQKTRSPQAAITTPASRVSAGADLGGRPPAPSGVPRDARIEMSNTRAFADFIRSTGPDNPLQSNPNKLPVVATLSSQIAKSQGRIRTSKSGPRLQAREPKVRRSENADLINFLREGPPPDRAGSDRAGVDRAGLDRVATNVVKVPPKFDQNSVASTQDSFVTKSIQSSTNSRTGLLETQRNGAKPAPVGKRQPTEEGMPARKQRRIRDPYAIDSDSEDDMDDASTPRAGGARGAGGAGGAGKEESLVDFLNSVPPPEAGNSPQPLNLSKSTIKAIQRKSSNAGSRAKAALPTASAIGSKISSAAGSLNSQIRSGNGDNHDTIREDDVTPAPRFSRPRPQIQARDERGGSNSVKDLADFLKNSAPPPSSDKGPSAPYSPSSAAPKSESGLSKMLNRRKKNAV